MKSGHKVIDSDQQEIMKYQNTARVEHNDGGDEIISSRSWCREPLFLHAVGTGMLENPETPSPE